MKDESHSNVTFVAVAVLKRKRKMTLHETVMYQSMKEKSQKNVTFTDRNFVVEFDT
jgi:hypothetical protein